VVRSLSRTAAAGPAATGIPVADIRFNFYAGERPLGNVGVDIEFLTAHQMGSSGRRPRTGLIVWRSWTRLG